MRHSLRMSTLRQLVRLRALGRELRCCCYELHSKSFRRRVFKTCLFWTGLLFALADWTLFMFVEPFVSEEVQHRLHYISGVLYRTAAVLALLFVLFEPKEKQA